MVKSGSVWALSSHPLRLLVGGVFIIGFVLLFLVECLSGNKYGILESILWALTPAGLFAAGILFLFAGLTRTRQEHRAWYKQGNVWQGIGYILMASGFLMILIVSINVVLPPLLALAIVVIWSMMMFLAIIQSFRVNQVIPKS